MCVCVFAVLYAHRIVVVVVVIVVCVCVCAVVFRGGLNERECVAQWPTRKKKTKTIQRQHNTRCDTYSATPNRDTHDATHTHCDSVCGMLTSHDAAGTVVVTVVDTSVRRKVSHSVFCD